MSVPVAPPGGWLGPAEFRHAHGVLTRAFREYPLVDALFPGGRRREPALSWYMGYLLRYCNRYGVVYVSPHGDGVACFMTAGHRFTYRRLFAAGLFNGIFRLGPAGFWRLMENDAHVGQLREKYALPGSWYTMMAGVDPGAQKRGVGRELLRRMLAAADEAGAPCFTETHRRESVPYARSQGFEVAYEGRVPSSGLPVWILTRAPRPPRPPAAEA